MKTRFFLFTILALSLMTSSAFAEPERLQIRKEAARSKERSAKTQIKNIDLRKVTDPEARKALQEILNYLNLQTKG